MIKNIIFDFDGVIIESLNIKTEAFSDLFSSFPDQLNEIISYHRNNSGVSRFKKIKYYLDYILPEKYNEKEYKDYVNKFGDIVRKKIFSAPFVPGAFEFLSSNSSLSLFIASATPEQELKEIVKRKKISKYFKGTFGSPKTKAVITKNIINSYNLKKNETIFIGDAIADFNAAKINEIKFIGRISDKNFNPFRNLDEKNIMIIDDLLLLEENIKILSYEKKM